MTEVEILQALVATVQDLGIWAIFAYLYINEKRAHQNTILARTDDLREIAGFKNNIHQTIVQDSKKPPNFAIK